MNKTIIKTHKTSVSVEHHPKRVFFTEDLEI